MQCGRGCRLWGRVCPCPLPTASCLQRGWAGPQPASSSLDLLRPLFCEWPATCSGRLIFSLSFAVPQFKLVSHKSSLRLPSGHSGPVLTLSNAARSSPYRPHLLVANAGVWGTFLLRVAFMHVICGFYLFSSQLGCPPRFENFPLTRQCEGFPGVWKLPLLRLPSWDRSPSLALLSLSLSFFFPLFIFYILSYPLLKTVGCFSGHLMS